MRNDVWFRVHYPYGIVFDFENKTFALFNRFYKRLGEGRDEAFQYKSISELLEFSQNENISNDLKTSLEKWVKTNKHSMSCSAEENYFRIWFYNDSTNPYAYSKRNVRFFNLYMERLHHLSDLLNHDLEKMILLM